MDTHVEHEQPSPVADRLREVSEAISRLVKEHVELAKAEVQANVKKAGRDIGMTAAGAGLLAIGYLLLMFAISYFIADALGSGWAFLIVGGAHLIVGAALVLMFAKRLKEKDKPGLPATTRELHRDRVFLGEVGHIVRDEPHARGT